MAHHKATKKSIKQTAKITERNVSDRSRIRGYIKAVETAVEENNKEQAPIALKKAQKELLIGVRKNIVKLSTASRKISRLNAKVKKLATAK